MVRSTLTKKKKIPDVFMLYEKKNTRSIYILYDINVIKNTRDVIRSFGI